MFSLAGNRQSVNSAVILNLIQSDEGKKKKFGSQYGKIALEEVLFLRIV